VLTSASGGTASNGLTITAGNCVIRGLVINRFQSFGVLVNGSGASPVTNNRLEGCLIGTNSPGTAAQGNDVGVSITGPNASDNIVGGTAAGARNVISGNRRGVEFFQSAPNFVQGNLIVSM
jgi:hypothetical protein